MIVLDTNQLDAAAFPHGAILGMLRKIAEIHKLSLAIPEMVAVEHTAHHRHDVELAIRDARKALSTLDKAYGQDLTSQVSGLSADGAADRRRRALEEIFTILPTPAGAAEEALKREANRQPPANQVWDANGKPVKASGARDVTIWLTLLEAAAANDEDVWFLSMDGDFGKGDFHPLLRQEAEQKLGEKATKLRLLTGGIEQLLSELVEPVEAPENLEELLNGPVVAHAVNIASMGGALFFRLLPTLSSDVGDPSGYFKSSGILLKLRRLKKHRTYRVEDRIWVSAQLDWQGAKIFEHLQGQSAETVWAEEINFAFETTVLLEVQDARARSAEVVSAGALAVSDTHQLVNPGDQGIGWALVRHAESAPLRLVRMQIDRG
ncbi:PIN domain-containing protein [Streptomyces coeruleorubidus]|uniref:PIN domain-containing protein n=1 Tax=Streptomyces coeruleorubidus TaxID=116188 RepID=UPI0034090060